MNTQERFRGCLLGLAVGDAVGTTLEFERPGEFEPITDMVGGGPFRLKPGQWTDDTSMALCLAESLLQRQGFDPMDQMERYVRWWRKGYLSSTGRCFDIGNTVQKALADFEKTRNPYSGSTDEFSAGNGSLMRLAPVAMFYAADPAKAIEMCGESSRTTHGAIACIDACRYYGALLVAALGGASKQDLLSNKFVPVDLSPEVSEVAAGSFRTKRPPQIRGTGFVVQSLEAALWAFASSETYREGCLLAANLGEDADTTAAIFGQIAGSHYGEAGIPVEWRQRLHDEPYISELAERLRA